MEEEQRVALVQEYRRQRRQGLAPEQAREATLEQLRRTGQVGYELEAWDVLEDVMEEEHRYDLDTDRCTCGGLVVYFEDGDADGYYGEGCDVEGRVWPEYRVQPGGVA